MHKLSREKINHEIKKNTHKCKCHENAVTFYRNASYDKLQYMNKFTAEMTFDLY